jgi:predicted nucleic acid-binding protein
VVRALLGRFVEQLPGAGHRQALEACAHVRVTTEGLLASADEDLHAPALLDFEVASALRGHVLGGRLDPVRLDMTSLLGHMLDLRDNLTVCDAAYLVLAQALEAPVVSAEAKLGEATRLGIGVQPFS